MGSTYNYPKWLSSDFESCHYRKLVCGGTVERLEMAKKSKGQCLANIENEDQELAEFPKRRGHECRGGSVPAGTERFWQI